MIKELKNLLFKCDMCSTSILLREVETGTLPNGWTHCLESGFSDGSDGYGFLSLDSGGIRFVKHYCLECSHKREVREVFK